MCDFPFFFLLGFFLKKKKNTLAPGLEYTIFYYFCVITKRGNSLISKRNKKQKDNHKSL